MPTQGGRSFDIIRQLVGNVVNIFNKRAAPCTAPCDGKVLRMHYQWTFWIFLAGFSTIWYSWFHRDVITCASHFNAETQVRLDYVNICLSYPFVKSGDERRYLLFYRWIHWVFLVLAAVYYIPRKIAKNGENVKAKKLLEDLAMNAHRYDQVERDSVDRTARYMSLNVRTHNGLYYKYLSGNLVALFIDIVAFNFLDFVLQGRFMQYGARAYPFNRDPRHFTDYMSQTFPPFTRCELTPQTQLTNQRSELLGCHLTVMELYEKIFVFVWFWLLMLIISTMCYLVFLGLMWMPKFRLVLLRVAKPVNAKDTVRQSIVNVISNCKIGDIYLLYRLKQHLSHARFYELLNRLGDPNQCKLMLENVTIDMSNRNQQDMRQRKPQQSMKAPGKFPPALFTSPDGRGFLPNSSILVE